MGPGIKRISENRPKIINYFVFPRHYFEFDPDLFDFVNCNFMIGPFKILRKFKNFCLNSFPFVVVGPNQIKYYS